MAWIQSHQELAHHPKTRRLARRLGIAKAQALGHLHLLWWWALDYAPDGATGRWADADLADAAEWDGDPAAFRAALREAGFLDPDDRVHDWDDYGGRILESRRRRSEAGRLGGLAKAGQARAHAPQPPGTASAVPELRQPATTAIPVPRQGVAKALPVPSAGGDAALPSAGGEPAAGAAGGGGAHWAIWVAFCETAGTDPRGLRGTPLNRQLLKAKALAEAGMTADDVRRMTGWLLSQTWRENGVDLWTLEQDLARWVSAGKPDGPRPRRPVALRETGRAFVADWPEEPDETEARDATAG